MRMGSCEYDVAELVRRAQLGDRESLDRLAEAARVRLHEYVFRLTLIEDVTQDIVQETILEMLRLFGKLRQADRFWAWLYGIAFNKVRNHFSKQWRHKTRSLSENEYEPAGGPGGDVLAKVVTEELKQIVLRSIQALEPRHRAVLTMRCYDRMSYAQIGELMKCSEIGTRALFYRAKKALTRELSRHGFTKGSLVLALIVFGKITATSEAAAAEVSVTAATLSVGPLATLIATATGKVGIVTLVTASVVAAGSAAVTSEKAASLLGLRPDGPAGLPTTSWRTRSPGAEQECWHYYPAGPDQAVMTRLLTFDSSGNAPVSLILQNQYANYHYDYRSNTVTVRNHRMWEEDLRTRQLPTDPPALSEFLSQVEGRQCSMDHVTGEKRGLLVIYRRSADGESKVRQVDQQLTALEEEYFQFGWPESARIVDQRDPMHRRGRTYFRIRGRINGTPLSGVGRLPLVYAASRLHSPWLDLRIGRRRRVVDRKDGAVVYDRNGRIAGRYPSGSFFKGLARPWMGLHSIDAVRRDAATQKLRFQTRYDGGDCADVLVKAGTVTLSYTINMEQDIVERITFVSDRPEASDSITGQLDFTYLEDTDGLAPEFTEPRAITAGAIKSSPYGMLWLTQLLQPQDD